MGNKTIPGEGLSNLEYFYPPFVAGTVLPHQGVVNSLVSPGSEIQQPSTFQCREMVSLKWRHIHNERDGVSNHRRLDCLLNRLFRRRSKNTSKLRVTALCEGNPGTLTIWGKWAKHRDVAQRHVCSHRTSNGDNPWSGLIDMNYDQWASPYGWIGNDHNVARLQVETIP